MQVKKYAIAIFAVILPRQATQAELPIRKDLRLVTEEGYSLKFYLRDSFGSVVILDPMLDSTGNPVR